MTALPRPTGPLDVIPLTAEDRAARKTLVRNLVLGIVGGMILAGGLLAIRRVLEFTTTDMPRGTLFATAICSTVLVKFGRIAWRRTFGVPITRRHRLLDQAVGWGSSLGLFLLAAGCCYPAYRNSDWLIWLPMLIADQFWRQTFFDDDHPELSVATLPLETPLTEDNQAFDESELYSSEPIVAAGTRDERLLQQLFRVRDVDGYEVIYGTVRADFATGQRNATVHVGFCPPLTALPAVEAEASDFAEARVKVVQAFAHGVRLDVRLSEPAEEACSVAIDLAASPLAA